MLTVRQQSDQQGVAGEESQSLLLDLFIQLLNDTWQLSTTR